jgi:hypothetical protein
MGDIFDQAAATPSSQSGDVFDQAASGASATPNQPTDIAHQPASFSGVMQTLSTKEGLKAVADPAIGFAKGVGDTVHGVGELIRKVGNYGSRNSSHPGEGDRLIPPVGQAALEKLSTDEPGNPAQHTGKALENVAEFMTGEGAANAAGKALSLGEKVKKLGDIGVFLEKYPVVAKMLATGAKTGVVTGAQTTVKTGSPTQGAAGAVVGAGLGAAGEGVGQAASKGYKYVRDLYRPLVDVNAGTGDVAAGTIPANKGVIDVRTGLKSPLPGPKDVRSVQPVVQQGIRETFDDVAKNAGVQGSSASSLRDVASDVADNVKAKSQPVFQKLDELSGGKFSDAQAAANRYRGSIDKAGKDAYAKALANQDALFEKYKGSFEPDAFAKAKADWRQYRALQDVNDALNKTIVGQRPEVSAVSSSKQPGEEVNPKMMLKKLNDLYNDCTLETAVGKDAAHKLLDHAGSAQNATESIKEYNRQFLQANRSAQAAHVEANRAQNAATLEKNKAFNTQTIAQNREANQAIVESNKAANSAKVRGRALVGATGAAALGGAVEAGRTLARHGVKSALGGQ